MTAAGASEPGPDAGPSGADAPAAGCGRLRDAA